MNHRRFAYTLLVDVTAAAIIATVLIGVSLVAPDWLIGAMCVGLIPALVVAILIDTIRRRPLTDTDRYCTAVDIELDAAESRRRDHPQVPLTSPDRDVSRVKTRRGPGSRLPISTAAGSDPFPFDWPER